MNLARSQSDPGSPSNGAKVRFALALALGVLGIAASIASLFATPIEGATTLGCGIEMLSCTRALTSNYSKVGEIPLGILGLFYFVFWTTNLHAYLRTGDPIYRLALAYTTLTGSIISVILGSLMFFVLKAPCLYCLLTHLANLSSLTLLWPLLSWKFSVPVSADHVWHFLTLTSLSLLAASALFFFNHARILALQLEYSTQTLW